MPIDPQVNKILKEMWRIDEKKQTDAEISDTEKEFYNTNLSIMQEYYSKNSNYWQNK